MLSGCSGVGALSLAASAAAQQTTSKETVPAGAPKITKNQLKERS